MAVKPSECDGVTLAMVQRIDTAEAAIDEELRAKYRTRQTTKCPTGYALSEREKELLSARYAGDWTMTFDYSRASGETIAVLNEKEKTDEMHEQTPYRQAEGADEAFGDAEDAVPIRRADQGCRDANTRRAQVARKGRRRH